MLNMMAMPAARGGHQAAYLWKEAVTDAEPQIAKSELDRLVAEGADYEELVDHAYQERLARLPAAAIPPPPHHALHGIDLTPHELLYEKATADVMAALDRYDAAEAERLAHFGVQYRTDTAPELAELLRIDLYSTPRLDDLKNLLSGRTADGEQPEGKRQYRTSGKRNTVGSLALRLSADKSVSVVFGLSSPDERRGIVRAQANAVDVALHQLADKLSFLRARRDGLDQRDPANLTWVQWHHRQSRRGDPHLHTHVTVLNVVRSRVDGKVGTFDTFALHGFYPTVRETYHRALAVELRKLDLPVEFDAKLPAARITGIPEQVLRHFSGRTADAEAWLRDKGVDFASLTPHQRNTWLDHATKKTRQPKAMYYIPGNGHAAWHARAAGQGYVPPPQFVSPQALQRAGIVHTQVIQTQGLTQQQASLTMRTRAQQQRQSRAIRPQLDSRYNVGGGHYDEGHKHGRSL